MTHILANHLWQSTIFALAALLLTLALRNNRAQWRFAVWFAASVKFLIPFSWLVSLGYLFERPKVIGAAIPVSNAVAQMAQPFDLAAIQSTAQTAFPWTALLAGIWLCGFLVIVVRWTVQWVRLRRIVRKARPMEFVSQIRARSSSEQMEPGVFGVLKPVLLLPEGICERLEPEQLSAIVAHELCHIRRRDNLTSLIHMVVEAIFWFHPLVWWIGAHLLQERERACDEAVVQLGNPPEAYAEGILNVCRFCLESPLPCVAGVTGADLKKRIEEIMARRLSCKLTAARKLLLAGAALTAIAGPIAFGILHMPQARAQTRLQYEIASIKPADPSKPGVHIFVKPGGNLDVGGATLKQLITNAYGVRDFQVSGGPAWIGSDRFDIQAKTDQPPPLGPAPRMTDQERMEMEKQMKERLQALLADRFQLTVRQETKEMPIYVLVQAKSGSKLKHSDPEATGNHGLRMDRGTLTGMSAPLDLLARGLSNVLSRPVIDSTGLDGKFDWKLEWTPDPAQARPGVPGEPTSGPEDSGPSIFTALDEQLGLKLESRKGPAPVVIVDRAEKPSAN